MGMLKERNSTMGKLDQSISDHIGVVTDIYTDESFKSEMFMIAACMFDCYEKGGKLLIAGNGGSAADAQHIAGELVGQFYSLDRPSIPAIALSTDTSVITSIANDRGFDKVFSRQVEGLGTEKDTLIVISTSGNSTNLQLAAEMAHNKGLKVIGLLGKQGGSLKDLCDRCLIVPSDSTPRIQEMHLMIYHILCQLVESMVIDSEEIKHN